MALGAYIKAAGLGLLIAALGVVFGMSPVGFEVEETLGLDSLFRLRGPHPAPSDVVVVTIDQESARRLNLENEPRKWPRDLHARLVENLSQAGVRVIGFDIFFAEKRDVRGDRAFVTAVERAGNVVLFEYLRKETIIGVDAPSPSGMTLEQRVPPFAELAAVAAARAPFPLPKVPVKVSQFWAFKHGAGDSATLPVVMFQLFARDQYTILRRELAALVPEQVAGLPLDGEALLARKQAEDTIRTLRSILVQDPELVRQLRLRIARLLEGQERSRLKTLLSLYSGPASHYLNFYGPPRSIVTVPYHRVLNLDSHPELDLRGKAVFVGFSERSQPEQKDGFYTVFSEPTTGLDVSGVEIGATAFANLLEGRTMDHLPLGQWAALLVVWGLGIGALCRLAAARDAVFGTLSLSGLLVGWSYYQFLQSSWWPWITPVAVQAPLALFLAFLWRYVDTNRERDRLRKAFGYFLPDRVVDELARNLGHLGASNQVVYGAVLSTDAERYTSVSEGMAPARLAEVMNHYYKAIFPCVRHHGGIVSDVVGDAMLAIWATPQPQRKLRAQACHAALELMRAVETFNAAGHGVSLPTRIGVHAGELMLGNIGAEDHYEFRAVGDIVNSAARIQELNKFLKTRILISDTVAEGLDEFLLRELGSFRLRGKTRAITVYELVGPADSATAEQHARCAEFATALAEFRARHWERAAHLFSEFLARYPDDGPARPYRERCTRYISEPPESMERGEVYLDIT